jgi:ubiquitin-conjugating enzyme E2 R
MSSLHPSGDNEIDNESFDIRWKPINSVSSIINSVLLILQEPNFSSPANIDASVQWQKHFDEYKVRIAELCKKSKSVFNATNSSVFIPHPDSNPSERSMYKEGGDEEDNDDWDLENMEDSGMDSSGDGDDDDEDFSDLSD